MTRAARWLSSPHLPTAGIFLAILICSPSIWHGWQVDDYTHQLSIVGHPDIPEFQRPFSLLFDFVDGKPGTVTSMMEQGRLPWWTNPELKLSFYRPVTGFTHWLDYQLWPASPALMHIHSLVWFALAIYLTCVLYRTLQLPAWTAGLACLLFALDDGHGVPATWIANRNALIALAFGLASILSYAKARQSKSVLYTFLTPLFMLIALLANEGALAVSGYLLAYALFLDRDALIRRLIALIPAASACVLWMVYYKAGGFGASGSATYIDPVGEFEKFVPALVERFPLLIMGQWLVPSDFFYALSRDAKTTWYLVACLISGLVAVGFFSLLRARPTSRFFALGMVISIIPVCATFSQDRLLLFASIGGAGLLAELLIAFGVFGMSLPQDGHDSSVQPSSRRWPVRWSLWLTGCGLVFVHLLFSPFHLGMKSYLMKQFGEMLTNACLDIPTSGNVSEQTWYLVNPPTSFIQLGTETVRATHNDFSMPGRIVALYAGVSPLEISRIDDRTLRIEPRYAMLRPSDTIPYPDDKVPVLDPNNMAMVFDGLLGEDFRMDVGDEYHSGGVRFSVNEVDPDGYPSSFDCAFPVTMDDPSQVFLQWTGTSFSILSPPAVNESAHLPAARLPLQ